MWLSNKYMLRIISLLIIISSFNACGISKKKKIDDFSRNQLVEWNKALTQVVITDVLTPPVCSRVYAYSNIAAYEALAAGSKEYASYAGKLNGLTKLEPEGIPAAPYNKSIAGMIAFSTVAQKMVFNSAAVQDLEDIYLQKLDEYDVQPEVLERSIAFGRKVGQHIIDWAAGDGYLQRNANAAYIVTKQEGRWIPTPPDYTDAIEPNWHTLKPFILDSISQFRPVAPLKFDTTKNSEYFKQAMEVYDAVTKPGNSFVEIAKFWDCNPNISITQGHVMYFQQKISPAGHWIHITANVCVKEKFDELKTASILSKVAIGMADAFKSCWEAKFHYNSIRPETVINRFIDKDWRPLLQTPPFPEYPSGHSVVSGAASTVLSSLVDSSYKFIDSTEVPFGMPARTFESFNAAASEASISRLYGGIHFLPALNNGLGEGRQVAELLLQKLK
jgi:hypothetical protein